MRRFLLVICLSAGLCILLFPTTGAPATTSATTENLQLSQTSAHGGAYTTYTDDGRLRLTLGDGERGLNDEAVTTIDHVLELTYTGSDSATVWLKVPTPKGYFYRDSAPNQRINSEATGVTLASGEAVTLGLRLDTRDEGDEDPQIDQFDGFQIAISAPTTDGADDTAQVPVDPVVPSDEGNSDGNSDEGSDGPGEPDENTPTEPDGDDGEPPADPPDGSPPNVDAEPGDGTGPDEDRSEATLGENGDTGGSVVESGTVPETTQTTLGSIRWILFLVLGLICGTTVAVVMRRLIT